MFVGEEATGCMFPHQERGVWVPAFAGTTVEFLARRSRAASRGELLLFRRRGLPLAQFVAREFSDRRPGQFVDEFERGRNLVLAELAGEERLQFFQRERRG